MDPLFSSIWTGPALLGLRIVGFFLGAMFVIAALAAFAAARNG